MTVHLLRETAQQAGHVHVHVACSDAAFRLPRDLGVAAFASGYRSAVDCPECLASPVPWALWRRNGPGQSVGDLGRIVPV